MQETQVKREWLKTVSENCMVFEDFIHRTIDLANKINKEPSAPNFFTKVLKRFNEESPKHKQVSISSDSVPEDSSEAVEIPSISNQSPIAIHNHSQHNTFKDPKLSDFIDPENEKTVWSHERSFRENTTVAVNNYLSRERAKRIQKVEPLPEIAGHLFQTAGAMKLLEKKDEHKRSSVYKKLFSHNKVSTIDFNSSQEP
jgi:hypothetical protein